MKTIGEKMAVRRYGGQLSAMATEVRLAALQLLVGRTYQHRRGRAPARRILAVQLRPRRVRVRMDGGRSAVIKVRDPAYLLEGGVSVWADCLRRDYERRP